MYTIDRRTVPTQRRASVRKAHPTSRSPLTNISTDDNGYQISLAIPGIDKDQLDIKVKENLLTISNKSEDKAESNYSRREFDFTSFSRSFTLPEDIDVEKIKATYENGVLLMTLPLKPEVKPISISIK